MNAVCNSSRGRTWLDRLTGGAPHIAGYPDSVLVADSTLAGRSARFVAVVPDSDNLFPRVRNGEVGLLEGWQLARAVRDLVVADRDKQDKSAIVAIVDVTSQAYGRREEAFGIHQALAAAAAAYADARLGGHPVIGLIVGKAISGGFLAHGYQANRLIALDDAGVLVHAMGKQSAARITMRSVEALESLAATVPPMAYDIGNYESLGLLWCTLELNNPDQPIEVDVETVRNALEQALTDILDDPEHGLGSRLRAANRAASVKVREELRRQWAEPELQSH